MWTEYPKEGCGALIGNKFIPIRNMAKHLDMFIFNEDDWIEAQLQGEITGIFHSHTRGPADPSEVDKMQAEHFDLPFYIISMLDYSVQVYIP